MPLDRELILPLYLSLVNTFLPLPPCGRLHRVIRPARRSSLSASSALVPIGFEVRKRATPSDPPEIGMDTSSGGKKPEVVAGVVLSTIKKIGHSLGSGLFFIEVTKDSWVTTGWRPCALPTDHGGGVVNADKGGFLIVAGALFC